MKYSPKYYEDIKKRFPKAARRRQLAIECEKAGPLDARTSTWSNWPLPPGIGAKATYRT